MESSALNTLEQNGSTERSGGVIVLELNETLKDETRVDIGGS